MKLHKILKNTSFFLSIHKISKLTPTMLKNPGKKQPKIWLKNFYKEYARYPQILLPVNQKMGIKKDLFETIVKRKSNEKFSKKPLSIETLSKILFFSAGINRLGNNNNKPSKRMYPSGAARYPLEIYPLQIQGTKDLISGVYHYNVKFHALEFIKKENFQESLATIGGEVNKEFLHTASVLLVITAVFGRTEIKYGKSAYKLILLEAGHLGQNICLAATALGVAIRPLGGFVDNEVNALLQLDEEKEQAIYILALGKS